MNFLGLWKLENLRSGFPHSGYHRSTKYKTSKSRSTPEPACYKASRGSAHLEDGHEQGLAEDERDVEVGHRVAEGGDVTEAQPPRVVHLWTNTQAMSLNLNSTLT